MRVFYALEFEDETKEYLLGLQKLVRERSVSGNFTLKDNHHLTLKFLGEVDHSKINRLLSVTDEIAGGISRFVIKLNRLGKFEKQGGSVVWAGLEFCREAEIMSERLDNILFRLGYDRDKRPFKPHITIGRQVILDKRKDLSDIIVSKEAVISKVSLMESVRTNGVLRYIPICSAIFGHRS